MAAKRKRSLKRALGHGFVLPAPLAPVDCPDAEVAQHVEAYAKTTWGPEVKAAHERLVESARPSDGEALLPFVTDALLDAGANPYSEEAREALPRTERRAYDRASDKYTSAWTLRESLITRLFTALALHDVAEERLTDIAVGDADSRVRLLAARALLESPRPLSEAALTRLTSLIDDAEVQLVRYGAAAVFRQDPSGATRRLLPLLEHDDWRRAGAVLTAIPAGHADPELRRIVGQMARQPDTGLSIVALFAIARTGMGPDLVDALLSSAEVMLAESRYLPEPLVECLADAVDPRALPVFVRALAPEMMVRVDLVLRGIVALGDPSALPAVERYLEKHPAHPQAIAVRDQLAQKELDPSAVERLEEAARALGREVQPRVRPEPPPLPDRHPVQMSPLEVQRAQLEAELGDELAAAAQWIRGAIGLVAIRTEQALPLGATRLGGDPDLPADFAWPVENDRALSFVAQLDLAALHAFDVDGRLPAEGWLVFFVDAEFDEAVEYLSVSRVVHLPGDAALVPTPAKGERYPACQVHPFTSLQLPSPTHPLVASLGPAYEDRVGVSGAEGEHQLLGYGGHEWDTPADAVPLLQLASDPHPDWTWGDEGHLVYFVAPDALAPFDVSAVFSQYSE